MHRVLLIILAGVVLSLGRGSMASAQSFPPLVTEIHEDHPLFIFRTGGEDAGLQLDQGRQVVAAWDGLDDAFKPYAVMEVALSGNTVAVREQHARAMLDALQTVDVPIVLEVADGHPAHYLPVETIESLLSEYSCIKGVTVRGMAFNEYFSFSGGAEFAMPSHARWLIQLIETVPRYGRFTILRLDELHGPRLMANAWTAPLYEAMRRHSGYIIPLAAYRGPHVIPQISAVLGMGLEGTVHHWGVAATSDWFVDARFIEPGVYGQPRGPEGMPPALYRAMILNGTMTGATVYAFDRGSDLWFGREGRMWDEAIRPTLLDLLTLRVIPRKDFVARKARVAFQLAEAHTPQDFRFNLRDIDGVYGEGLMLHGAYSMSLPGQNPELIPNSGRHYWTPILSSHAPADALEGFDYVVRPGSMASARDWTETLDRHHTPDGMGTAFISRVGRGVFILNTRENLYERQSFRVPALPAPVRNIEAVRGDDGVTLRWPFREGDVAYRVYKRSPSGRHFVLVADDITSRSWTDTEADPEGMMTYAVTALTSEEEAFEGTVNFGEYLVLSAVESRIAEAVTVGRFIGTARSRTIETMVDTGPESQSWWPNIEGLSDSRRAIADTIASRIEEWSHAVATKDLEGVIDLYSSEYEDPQGWRVQYVRRAFQWFFERYDAPRMHRQIRRWEFPEGSDPDRVNVLLYCRFTGVALTDPSGRYADRPAYFPRTGNGEIWLTFVRHNGIWRIVRTDPALPNFNDILSFSAGPYDPHVPGPDVYEAP